MEHLHCVVVAAAAVISAAVNAMESRIIASEITDVLAHPFNKTKLNTYIA